MRSRRGLNVLAVCGLMLGIMAISASGAQAGKWMINKANVAGELKVEAAIEVEPLGEKKEPHIVFLSTSGGNAVEILCRKISSAVGTVTVSTITGTVNIEECTTFINKKAEPGCNPTNKPIKAGGSITATLHETKAGVKRKVALAQGTSGVFMTLNFNEETCVALPPSVKITGSLWLEDCNGEFEVEKITHLIQEDKVAATELGGLFYGANKLTIDGSVNVSLSDTTHKGMTGSGLAE